MNTKLSALILASAMTLQACSSKETPPSSVTQPSEPTTRTDVQGPDESGLDRSKPVQQIQIKTAEFSAPILVHQIGGRFYFQVEGTFASEAFASLKSSFANLNKGEQKKKLNGEIDAIFSSLKSLQAIELDRSAEAGYFAFLLPYQSSLMARVAKTTFKQPILLNPVVHQGDALKSVRAHTLNKDLDDGVVANSTKSFSGLDSMNIPAFLKAAAKDIGEEPNGSNVRLGITDTGITLNHPSFSGGENGKQRVVYMRETTGEGSVYVTPATSLKAVAVEGKEDEVLISAEIIATPRMPALPLADRTISLKDITMGVSKELRAILLSENAGGAKLGVLLESTLNADDEPTDINHNGKLNDQFPMIIIPGAELKDTKIYFDASAKGDFRKAAVMGDWNETGTTVKLFAETMGFSVQTAKIPNSAGMPVEVISVGIVGFDPGNHGSHVAGIAAGAKTLQNDEPNTLARGAAPAANILMNRVCTNNAGCGATAGLIDIVMNGGADVVNMSLGGLSPFNDGNGVQETIINRLSVEKNALFVISAGNSGPGRQTVGSPSTARLSLSVGATANRSMIEKQYQWPGTGSSKDGDEDFMLFFSSRGPTAAGGFKPNISAPGTELSAVQLNTAGGGRSGLDVYWGTSMAAPSATGAYALFLDAIRKYNAKNPAQKLSTNAQVLRSVLMASARPFDLNRFDPTSGERLEGQYTWIDEGMGMVDLVSAWDLVKKARDQAVPNAVKRGAEDIRLDYDVMIDNLGPNGVNYNGSLPTADGTPAYAKGLFLDAAGKEKLFQANITRRLPVDVASAEDAGDLHRQLVTTQDEFVLKTLIYGSNISWIKAGVRDELDCGGTASNRHVVIGRGAEPKAGGINPSNPSALNICVDRAAMQKLSVGDHGAMILAYRAVGDKVEPLPSINIPIYVSVPHQVMADKNFYEAKKSIKSFGVDRHYVKVPVFTSVLLVTVEVPEYDGTCSGVELMSLEGMNVIRSFATRAEARAANCDAKGAPTNGLRKISFTRTNPTPGMWDLHIFGSYKFKKSDYKIRVDYLTAKSSTHLIAGGLEILKGSVDWKLLHSSLEIKPSSEKSSLDLSSLTATLKTPLKQDEQVMMESPLGKVRKYPAEVRTVTVKTSGAPGSDIDMAVLECAPPKDDAAEDAELECEEIGSSAGSTDVEAVKFIPKEGKLYQVRADGFDVKGGSVNFDATEILELSADKGSVVVQGQLPDLKLVYAMSDEQIANSKILNFPLFKEKKYDALGALILKSETDVLLDTISLKVSAK